MLEQALDTARLKMLAGLQDIREKDERIAFVKRVAEGLYIRNEIKTFDQCLHGANHFYDKLKEWESKQ